MGGKAEHSEAKYFLEGGGGTLVSLHVSDEEGRRPFLLYSG